MNPELILISFSLFTWGIGEGMFLYFQPIYLHQLGASTMMIAGVFSAFGAAMMIAHIPAGYLSDKIGRRPIIWAAWCFGLAAIWFMALTGNLTIFIIGMVMYGLTAFVSSPLFSYITAARGNLSPARAMTFTSAAFNLGAILGPISGGWIAEHYGLRAIYFVAGCIVSISTILIFFLRDQPRDQHDPAKPPERLFMNSRFLGLVGVGFVSMFVMYLPQPLTPNFLETDRGLTLGLVGLVGSIGSIGTVVINLLFGQLNARLGFILAQVLVGLFAFLLWRGNNIVWYGLAYFLLGGYRAARMMLFAQVRPLIHKAQMGLSYGIAETANSLAIILAPLLAGWLYTFDPLNVYKVALIFIILSIIVSIYFTPHTEIPSQEAIDLHASD